MAKTIKINNVDVTSYFTPTGMLIEYNDISGGNEGYMMDGSYTADIIATKRTITLACMPLTALQWKTLKNSLGASQYASLYYYDPIEGYITITAMYAITGGRFRGVAASGEYWTGFALTFTER